MSAWDYIMPHRLLVNRSLRKAAQELRDRVELYQIEFDRRLEDCKSDLQRAEEDKNKELETFKAALLQELRDDHQVLEEIQGNIVQYIDCYFNRSYLYQLVEIYKRENDIFHEDYTFLSNEIKSIEYEIGLLRERQNELTAFTKVDDIIHLATLTGYDLDFQSTDDAKQLLGKISAALETYSGEDRVEKYALLRLKAIIQERSDYLPTISYISWVIKLKREFRKQLLSKRSDVKREQAALRQEMNSKKGEIRILTNRLDLLAEKVRYYWAKPITYLNADICYAYVTLKEERTRLRDDAPSIRRERKDYIERRRSAISEIRDKKSKRRDVGSELRSMRDSHSHDQWKWESLQREGSSLTSDIDSLSSDIDDYSAKIDTLTSELESLESAVKTSEAIISSKKKERKQWGEKRSRIVGIIRQYDKKFRSDRKIAERDEISIIDLRLSELQQIREVGVIEAQEVYKRESDEIQRVHAEKVIEFESRKQLLETQLQDAETEYTNCMQHVSIAEKKLESSKNSDDRFVLFRLLSESDVVTAAKGELEKARAVFAKAKEDKKAVEFKINELEKEMDAELESFHTQVANCKPRYLRPTSEEQREEKKLLLRREEINLQRKEGGHES